MALFLLLSFARAFIPDLPISKDGTRVHEKDFSRFFFLLENIQKTFEVCLFGPPKRISGFQKTQNTWRPDLFIRFNSLSWVIYVLPLQNYFARQKAKHVPTFAMLDPPPLIFVKHSFLSKGLFLLTFCEFSNVSF